MGTESRPQLERRPQVERRHELERRPRRNAALVCLALVLALTSTGCFERPVEEALELVFAPSGELTVRTSTRVHVPAGARNNRALVSRVEGLREALLRGEDLFGTALAAASPRRQDVTFRYEKGDLVGCSRVAVLEDDLSLETFLRSLSITGSLRRSDDDTTLELFPSRAGRAGEARRKRVDEVLSAFSAAMAGYVTSAADVYAYLGKNPGRARPVFRTFFEGFVPEEANEDAPGDTEKRLVSALGDRMGDVLALLVGSSGENEATSLEEDVQLTYDPFPARISVTVAGKVLESSGFVRGREDRLEIPPLSLRGALLSLSDRWVSPDPLAINQDLQLRKERDGSASLDLDGLLGKRRVVNAAGAREIRAAVERALSPAEAYRLRWVPPPARPDASRGR